jgi:ParB family chromosome partitioning protein
MKYPLVTNNMEAFQCIPQQALTMKAHSLTISPTLALQADFSLQPYLPYTSNINIDKINQKCIFLKSNILSGGNHMTTETEPKTTPLKKDKIHHIPVSELSTEGNPRQSIDEAELDALKVSIEEKGLIYPIIFRIDDKGNKVVVSGSRRLRAFQALGRDKIPAMLLGDGDHDEIALVDNVQREGLHPIDEAEALYKLQQKYDYSQDQIGNLFGKKQNTISTITSLMKIPEDIRNEARQVKGLSRNALLKIAAIKRPTSQRKAYDALVASLGMPKKEIKRPRLGIPAKAIKTTQSTRDCIKEIDINALGEDREAVVSSLQDLLQEIQNKLASIGG